LEAAKEDRFYAYYTFALDSGAGPGDCLALDRSDVRFDTGMVSIVHSRHAASLHDHRKQALADGFASALVLHDTQGGHLRNGNVTKRSFKLLLKKAGVPEIRLCDLRHICATLLLLAGVPAKVVSEKLGNASVTITLNTYSHILPAMRERAAEALHRVFTAIWSQELIKGASNGLNPSRAVCSYISASFPCPAN
jgi:integrase